MDHILSASKLKTLKSCSWLFWCNYGDWRLPKTNNDGARRGQVVHSLFECLLNPKHKHYYSKILESQTVVGIPVIERFVRRKMKAEEMSGIYDHKDNHNFELIDEMIQVGLRHDFYCHKGELEKAETAFDYENKELGYSIRGFIDKIVNHGDHLQIYDYKTSARVFEGEDLSSNVQAMMYSLYAKRVRDMNAVVKFIFLRFPENPLCKVDFSEEVINGFEHYLTYITKYLKSFTFEDARSNLAAYQPHPGKGEGFKGPLLCGYGKFPGHANKEGKVYWVCDYKWPFDYFALVDNNTNKILKTAFKKEDLTIGENSRIESKRYFGCPAHQNKLLTS